MFKSGASRIEAALSVFRKAKEELKKGVEECRQQIALLRARKYDLESEALKLEARADEAEKILGHLRNFLGDFKK